MIEFFDLKSDQDERKSVRHGSRPKHARHAHIDGEHHRHGDEEHDLPRQGDDRGFDGFADRL